MRRRTFLQGALAAMMAPMFMGRSPAAAAPVAAQWVGTGKAEVLALGRISAGDLLAISYRPTPDGVYRMCVERASEGYQLLCGVANEDIRAGEDCIEKIAISGWLVDQVRHEPDHVELDLRRQKGIPPTDGLELVFE